MAITTRKKSISNTPVIESHRRACGEVWTQVVQAWHLLYDEYDYWLPSGDAESLFATGSLSPRVLDAWENVPIEVDISDCERNPFVTNTMRQAGVQQRQQLVQRFYEHLRTFFDELLPQWRENGKDPDDKPEPPHNPKRHGRVDFVHNKIERDGDTLRLRTGSGLAHIELQWLYPEPRAVEIIWQDGGPVVCAQYDSEKQDLPSDLIRDRLPQGEKTAGIDLGEVCIAAAHDGEESLILDGERLRQLRCVQNREKKRFAEKIDRKQRGSRRFWKLVNAKRDRLKELRDRIDDYLHKMSTRLVEELWSRGVSTIIYGDISGIREDIEYGEDMNRRLHQWAHGAFIEKVTYKAERYGIEVTSTREAYTSQTCPNCGTAKQSHKSGREFRCSTCDFEAHRDVVGAMNIRAKAQDPDGWSDGYLKGPRARPTGAHSSPKGSSEDRQLRLFERGVSEARRATQPARSPDRVEYDPHMDCVFDADVVSEG